MSYLHPDGVPTQKRFARLYEIPGHTEAVEPAEASLPAISNSGNSSRVSQKTENRFIQEGCLVTGLIDYSNEKLHFISDTRSNKEEQTVEQGHLEAKMIELGIVRPTFNLDHEENISHLKIRLHRHHDMWATIAISPSLDTLHALNVLLYSDNNKRQHSLNQGYDDPGRRNDLLSDPAVATATFTLIVLYPGHFLIGPDDVTVVNHAGGLQHFVASDQGFMVNQSNPQDYHNNFKHRHSRPSGISPNPFLVTLAASLRFRRYARTHADGYPETWHVAAKNIPAQITQLVNLIYWQPTRPFSPQMQGIQVGATTSRQQFPSSPLPTTFTSGTVAVPAAVPFSPDGGGHPKTMFDINPEFSALLDMMEDPNFKPLYGTYGNVEPPRDSTPSMGVEEKMKMWQGGPVGSSEPSTESSIPPTEPLSEGSPPEADRRAEPNQS